MDPSFEKPVLARSDTLATVVEPRVATSEIESIPGPVAVVPTAGPIPTVITSTPAADPSTPDHKEVIQDGGRQAWLVVLGSFLIHTFAFAPTEYVFGVFELHYHEVFQGATASSIAFVGTTGSAVTYLAGFLAGFLADRFGFRITALCGTFIMTVSLILASFAKQLWHLYITQGFLFGVGAALSYYPAIAAPTHYFTKRRGLAIGLAVSGVGLGGAILAPLTHELIERLGAFWALRVLALMCAVICGAGSYLTVERKAHSQKSKSSNKLEGTSFSENPEENEKPSQAVSEKDSKEQGEGRPSFVEALRVFKDPQFLSLSLAELSASIGFLIPMYYMQTYAVFIGVSAERGALILGLTNGASFVGRIVLGIAADYFSNTKMFVISGWGTAFSIMVLWTFSRSFGVLLLMGLTFGFFNGGYVSLAPVAIADSFGTKQIASTIGLVYAAGGIGMFGGSPFAGFLLENTRPNISYLPVQMAAGATLTIGAICCTSWAYFHWRAKRVRRATTVDTL
ncbi:hypothetical protein BGW38_010594 [Lunasporangiospora selenospora]|uniref:Major facilitator superfamily (MFS) profile domain-containing protein n=1 Tax=Lunasporangiospora selenospora TaxID=979761 RepID=A0A9P6G4B6_9FUNG|nr:hypothetical protein BGW38_010594 [Lunasporangiospora selenospora]